MWLDSLYQITIVTEVWKFLSIHFKHGMANLL